jgi:hypothetical protein
MRAGNRRRARPVRRGVWFAAGDGGNRIRAQTRTPPKTVGRAIRRAGTRAAVAVAAMLLVDAMHHAGPASPATDFHSDLQTLPQRPPTPRLGPHSPAATDPDSAAPLMTEQGLLQPDVTVLGKPFTKNELLTTLNTTLTNAIPRHLTTTAQQA